MIDRKQLVALLTDVAQILTVVQAEWSGPELSGHGSSWSAWDQSVRDRIIETIQDLSLPKNEMVSALVDRFLAWPLPKSVCSDLCVTMSGYQHDRSGTNLLTANEAKQMIEHLLKRASAA